MLIQGLAAVVMIAALVFIHEFGHFIVAKACGVHVPVFSFGFGRRLIGIEIGGTDYRISALPFGGYVQMAGADPFGTGAEDDDILDDPDKAFLRRPVWQRLLVIGAGPAFNLALPVVVFTALLMAGEPQPAPIIGAVESDSPMWQAGVRPGDQVTAVDGTPVQTWEQMSSAIALLAPGTWTLGVTRGEQQLGLPLVIDEPVDGGIALGLGYYRPGALVGVDDSKSPAGLAGLQTGDLVVQVDGQDVADWVEVQLALAAVDSAAAAVAVRVERDGEPVDARLSRSSQWSPVRVPGDSEPLAADLAWGMLPATIFAAEISETVEDAGMALFAGCRPPTERAPSPAYLAGLEPGDRFLRVDGNPIRGWGDVLDGVKGSMVGTGDTATARPVSLEMVRDGEIIAFDVTPEIIEDTDEMARYYRRAVVGVLSAGQSVSGPTVREYYPFAEALSRATEETIGLAGLIMEQLGELVTGGAAFDQSIGGPVEMVRQAARAAEAGVFRFARMLGMLSISLGIINLLPVPVLDGGQLVFFAAEGIRGRPLSQAVRERVQQVGVLFLVMLMLAVLVLDVHRAITDM